ncbi:MAG: AAA family ATPase, partial [Patescibacteria group bacterium]
MKLNRLTNRARGVIGSLSSADLVGFDKFFDEIEKSRGMGNTLLQSFPELKRIGKTKGAFYKKVSTNEVVKKAYYHSLRFNQAYVGTEHLLLALLTLGGYQDTTKVESKLLELSSFPTLSTSLEVGKKTPILDSYGMSLNHKVGTFPRVPIVFRDEFNVLVSVLLQKKNPNPLIVGDLSVGKRSLIDLLVRKINDMDVPPSLMGYRVIEFDLLSFVTATLGKGSMEGSLEALFDELRSVGRVILSIKNFQSLFYSTNMGVAVPLVFSAFKSGLDESNIKCIATISESFYSRIVNDNEHMLETFTVLNLPEPDEKKTIEILKANAEVLGEFHRITISDDVVDYIYRKAKDEISGGKFPQKGIDLMDQACAKYILKKRKIPEDYKVMIEESVLLTENLDKSIYAGNYDNALEIKDKLNSLEGKMWGNEKKMFSRRKQPLTFEDIDEALASISGSLGSADDLRTLGTLDERIKTRIIGQEEAVNTITKSLIRSKLGLRPKKRPIGSFLFLGPTGVGKTELAKVLAEEAFGEGSIIRLDMSDFAEKHNVARLVGAPPGYVGYGEGGELTSKIELKPDSVVLFDEIEKAH